MHAEHAVFLEALESKHQVTITFFHAKEKTEKTLTCAPLDFGPLRGAKDPKPYYQLWDLGAKRPPYNVTVLPEDVRSIKVEAAIFDPGTVITWKFKPNAWSHPRNWGDFS